MRLTRLTVLVSVLLAAAPAFASEPVGRIVSSEGICDISRAGLERVAAVDKTEVLLNDRIRTKSYSKLKIIFADKSEMKLAPNTCVTIQDFRQAAGKREMAKFLLTRGKVEAVVSKTGAPDTFVIDTPNARSSVKGSDVFVSFTAGRTAAFVKEGALSLAGAGGAGDSMHVVPGQCAFVSFDGAAGNLRPALGAEMKTHSKDVTAELVKKWAPGAGAQKMTASVVSVSGTVRFHHAGDEDWSEVKRGDTLTEGDTVQTGPDGKIEIRLSNGNAMFLEADTELAFTTLRIDPATGAYENSFDMPRGKVGAVVDRKGKTSTFKIATPTAIAAVRGTFIKVHAIPPSVQGGAIQSQVFFEGGMGDVTNPATNQTQQVGDGFNITADGSGIMSNPQATPSDQRAELGQAWSMNQMADNYSAPQDGGALGGQGPNGALGGPGPRGPGADRLPQLDNIGNVDIANPLPFDLAQGPPDVEGPNFVYANHLDLNLGALTSAGITQGNMHVALKPDGLWVGAVAGDFTGVVGSPWNVQFTNGAGDDIRFTLTGALLLNQTNGTFTVTTLDTAHNDINGSPIHKDLTKVGNPTGTYTSNSTGGSFEFVTGGTWIDS